MFHEFQTSPHDELSDPKYEVTECIVRGNRPTEWPPLVYVAGPYTKPDPVQNTHRMIRIADALLDLGVVPIVPHLTMFWHLLCPRPYGDWLEYDLRILARCDAMLRVPGESAGGEQETDEADRLGLTVLYPLSPSKADCVTVVRTWLKEIPAINPKKRKRCRTKKTT